MIKSINSMGKYIGVMSPAAPSTYINNYSGAQGLGNVRFNTTNQNFEVWDGNMWMQLSMAHAQIGLTAEAEELLDWAKKKRDQEKRIEDLVEKHPGIQDLKEKLDIMVALVDKDAQA
jgi:hypothetical protein